MKNYWLNNLLSHLITILYVVLLVAFIKWWWF